MIGGTNAPATTEYDVWIEERFNTRYGKERRRGERSLGTEMVDNDEMEHRVLHDGNWFGGGAVQFLYCSGILRVVLCLPCSMSSVLECWLRSVYGTAFGTVLFAYDFFLFMQLNRFSVSTNTDSLFQQSSATWNGKANAHRLGVFPSWLIDLGIPSTMAFLT